MHEKTTPIFERFWNGRVPKVNFAQIKMIAERRELERLWEHSEDPAKRKIPRSENHEVFSTLALAILHAAGNKKRRSYGLRRLWVGGGD